MRTMNWCKNSLVDEHYTSSSGNSNNLSKLRSVNFWIFKYSHYNWNIPSQTILILKKPIVWMKTKVTIEVTVFALVPWLWSLYLCCYISGVAVAIAQNVRKNKERFFKALRRNVSSTEFGKGVKVSTITGSLSHVEENAMSHYRRHLLVLTWGEWIRLHQQQLSLLADNHDIQCVTPATAAGDKKYIPDDEAQQIHSSCVRGQQFYRLKRLRQAFTLWRQRHKKFACIANISSAFHRMLMYRRCISHLKCIRRLSKVNITMVHSLFGMFTFQTYHTVRYTTHANIVKFLSFLFRAIQETTVSKWAKAIGAWALRCSGSGTSSAQCFHALSNFHCSSPRCKIRSAL